MYDMYARDVHFSAEMSSRVQGFGMPKVTTGMQKSSGMTVLSCQCDDTCKTNL